MTKAEIEVKKSYAKTLFLQGAQIKDISAKVGVSTTTLSKWNVAEQWSAERAARNITRPQIVQKMLAELDKKLDSGDWKPQDVAMVANSIAKLDKQTNVVTIIEVLTVYQNWLVERSKIDPDLDSDFLKKSYKYQDQFVNAQMSATTIN